MKKELGHNASRAMTVHHFFTFLNFVILLISVASLSFNVYILRREIENVKTSIRPLLTKNEKASSQLFDDYFFKSRKLQQMQHGPDEMGPGLHDMGPGSDGENAIESAEQPTEGGTTASPEQHGENATMELPTGGQTAPGGSPDQHGGTPGHGGENATMEMPSDGQTGSPDQNEGTPGHGGENATMEVPTGGQTTPGVGPEHHGGTTAPGGNNITKHGATVKLSCSKVRISVFPLLSSGKT